MSEQEWVDPRYTELAAAWKRAQQPQPDDREPRPARGFVTLPRG
ncbi:hypothetical protein [Streptomyces collinus]